MSETAGCFAPANTGKLLVAMSWLRSIVRRDWKALCGDWHRSKHLLRVTVPTAVGQQVRRSKSIVLAHANRLEMVSVYYVKQHHSPQIGLQLFYTVWHIR